jgi:hypothetical protein
MAHENNVTNFFIDSKGNKVWYNEVGKLHEGPRNKYHAKKQNPSAHPFHLNPRYGKKFKTKDDAEREAKSISRSYDKTQKMYKKTLNALINHSTKRPNRGK